MRKSRPVVVALLAVVALSACTPTGEGVPASSSSATPSAEATAVVATAPEALVGLGCEQLLPLATIQSSLSPDVVAIAAADSGVTLRSMVSPQFFDTALAQSGGISCLWANGDVANPSATFRGVSVRVLAHAADSWAAARDALLAQADQADPDGGPVTALGDESTSDCGYDIYYGTCVFDLRAGEYWVEVQVRIADYDVADPAAPVGLALAVASAAESLPAAADAWTPPSTTGPTPTTCAGVLSLSDVREQLAQPALEERFGVASLLNFESAITEAALAQAGGVHCLWVTADDASSQMSFDVIALPGADWSVDGTSAPRSSDGIALTSTPGLGDAAWGGCSDAQLRCTLHVFRGGSWFVLSVFNATTGLDALVALAHGVID